MTHRLAASWSKAQPTRMNLRPRLAMLGPEPPSAAPLSALALSLERRIVDTVGSGYRISLTAGELDLLEFDSHLERAQGLQANAELRECASTLRSALACWRGPALEGLASRALAAGAGQLNARRAAAYRQLMAIELSLHRHLEIVEELLALVQVHPFDEGLVQQGMLALYRCGRRADALALFHDLRAVLVDELC